MGLYEVEFYRVRRPWGNYRSWSLRLDSAKGTLVVSIVTTTKDTVERLEMTPDAFARSGSWYPHRSFKHAFDRLLDGSRFEQANA